MSFRLLSIFVNDNFDEFMKIDKDEINFTEPLNVFPSLLPPILKDGASITAACVFKGAEKCLSWILTNEDISNLYDFGQRSLYHFAAASSNPNIYTVLENSCPDDNQDHPDKDGLLPIHYAAMFGNLQVLQYLWMNGNDINAPIAQPDDDDQFGRPLARNDPITLLDLAIISLQTNVVNFLLANMEIKDSHFQSIFRLESHPSNQIVFQTDPVNKAKEILESFINAGLDIMTFKNKQGKTLFFFFLEKEDLDLVQILYQKIGNKEIRNEEGLTPYEYARRYKNKDIVDFVLKISKQ